MEYRTLPHGGEQISVIGMGSAVVGQNKEKAIVETVQHAVECGINYFDLAAGHGACFPAYGKALGRYRKKVYLQVHFGATYERGEYAWTTSLQQILRAIDWQLTSLKTDYIDFGYIHCMDEEQDLIDYEKQGVLQYLLNLKETGVVHHIGLSSHNPAVVHKVLDMGILDMLMFSINPMYDAGQGEYANGSAQERMELYRRCQREGVGIAVMKPYNAGILLDEKRSPFGKALTPAQCIQYALDKPAVLTALVGAANPQELDAALAWLNASEEERDWSEVSSLMPEDAQGRCVYCNHCAPCPQGINVGLVNKYYDLALAGDPLAEEHYRSLTKTAADCIQCRHCDERCPFHVQQTERMKEIAAYFRG